VTNIHPTAVVDKRARIGADAQIGPYCVIDGPAVIAARTRLISHVSIAGRVEIGEDCLIYPFVALGHPPQDFKYKGEETRLVLGDRNVLREHVTMHTGTKVARGQTVVGSDCYFMVGAHVAHDCIVGDKVILVNHGTLGGICTIEDHVIIGGLAGVHQNTRVGRHAFLGAGAICVGDVIPYGNAFGTHATLNGLNLVGLKRRGFSREVIHDLRVAYRLLASEEGTLQERIEEIASIFPDRPEVLEIVEFARVDSARNLCLP
jgi:UDP-N-acetylglucosamine acyltransferase